ncbi:ATP-dependent exoDNAse (exonuclease V) beta subunit [Candidatus Scalindua japonica]|uniref:DNA 3'-5' helicase n=1 Tax=Candidatus Scalindua japonica TaxID=1284222 RepID=A0A286U1H3_9BACT|nr:UvrD-helicase domain-containing protein [Candidatus Scalindua japonica]GAX61977.1 ATP-dependent exoDNAse (exonuclease V) beta subunit [Candidatus Scalindua japonica]
MADKLTYSQIKGVTTTDRDLCVVAGPGSGKTRVLIERFANIVTTRQASINEILTLTFTEKAANEMKIRAAGLFERKGMEKERQEIEFAYLSTIHSFCARLLRENAIEAALDPQFRVMDELEADRLKERALENTLKAQTDEKTLDAFLNKIFWKQTDSKTSGLKSFKENLMQLYEKIRNACVPIEETVNFNDLSSDISGSYNKSKELIKEIRHIYSESKLTPKTSEKVEYVLEQWKTSHIQSEIDKLYCGKEENHPFSPPSRPAMPFRRAQRGETKEAESTGSSIDTNEQSIRGDIALALLNKVKTIHSSINLQVSKDVKKILSNLRDELKTLIASIVEDYSIYNKIMLRNFLLNFSIAYSEQKKAESLIDFTDLEVITIELLENREHIANEIKRKFKHILVDEFQDISRLQKKIIDLIRSKDNLFIVGDARQSIYGFRNADVEIFQDIQNEIDSESLISLNKNFRSRPQILDCINHIFKELWPKNLTSKDSTASPYKKTPGLSLPPYDSQNCMAGQEGAEKRVVENTQLKPGAEFSEKSLPSIEIIVAEGKDKIGARKWESIEIAKRIKEIVDSGEIKITNKREHERDISYRDIAILFRSTKDIKLYERSFSHLDIPYYVVSGRGFYNTTEITDLINLLKVIESPLDEINLAAVLKSPFVGIDDDVLFKLADHAHSSNQKHLLYQSLNVVDSIKEIEKDSRDRIIQFVQLLNEVHNIKPRTSLWKLISFILRKTEFQTKMLLFSNGKKRYANLRKLVELCKNQEEFEPLALKDFIEIVNSYKFREIRESEAPIESEEDNVVKMITTHSAKGLEFPVVIVADTDRDNTRSSDYLVYSKDHGISFKILNPSTNEAEIPLSYEQINDEITQKELQESKRLLFVAMTRAQEHLILSGGISKSRSRGDSDKGNWYNYISASLDLNDESKDERKTIKLGLDSSRLIEVKHTCIKGENRPSAQKEESKLKTGKRLKLMTQHRREIAACNKIDTPSPSEKIVETGKRVLSRINYNAEIDNRHYVYSVTELLKFHFCPQLYYLNSILGLQGLREKNMDRPHSVEEDENRLNDDEIPGQELGNIVHSIFKKYEFPEDNLNEYIKKELCVYAPYKNQKSVDLIANWVKSFYNSNIGKEVLSSEQCKREKSFIFNHRNNHIRGQIDLFFFDKKGVLKIIDYKANDITIDEIPDKVKLYQLQMQLYARALQTIYGKKVDETILYFLIPDKYVVVDTTEKACRELDSTLDNFFITHKDGVFKKLRDQRCQWCEHSTIC